MTQVVSNGGLIYAPAPSAGVTLIELLVSVAIITLLMSLLLPVVSMARRQTHRAEARQTAGEIQVALDLYRRDEPRHRFPAVAPDVSIGGALLEELDRRGLWSWGNRERDQAGRLLDAWGQPYRYTIVRPAPSAGQAALVNWNWDAKSGHEARWGERPDPVSGARIAGALPFPYVWSLGPAGNLNDATEWLFAEDGK